MSDRLTTRNGESVSIDSMIEALEAAPDKAEILEALKSLRQDRVKDALNQTVKAAKFDSPRVFEEFLSDGEKALRTRETYRHECGRLFAWIEREGLHLLQLGRPDVNRFKRYLAERYAVNTVRLSLAACSSFYTYLEDERYIEHTPFAHITYPKKQYKKAVRTDQGRPVPVMSDEEYQAIVAALEGKATATAKMVYEKRSREAARRLLPIVHFMGSYGLRVSDVLTVQIEDADRFSFRQKGGEVLQRALKPESREVLAGCGMGRREPFGGIAKVTVQGAIRRVSTELAAGGGYPTCLLGA